MATVFKAGSMHSCRNIVCTRILNIYIYIRMQEYQGFYTNDSQKQQCLCMTATSAGVSQM